MTDSTKQKGQQWLESLLKLAGVAADVQATEVDSASNSPDEVKNYWLTIDETNLSANQVENLIGTQGTVLDGIQYLANAALNLGQKEQQAFYTIELNGYRAKRQAELEEVAKSAATQVLESGAEVEIKSLSSAERRQIHTILQDYEELETFSKGKEPHRHLVVRLLQPTVDE
ncbi:Jag family protein [Aliterella atlantica]|uniref:RNA-binding protein n=1 Tax=Aliterella atlantica CENA595 TaxID=1618023 RepID=A0A0D8ZU50_9CYAN|nr:R3H domain-containing nucleic acid-binding protein [Aliterella atlantica]KJH72245.1 RNA-binding protein [Aliterella atlantica CENA595]